MEAADGGPLGLAHSIQALRWSSGAAVPAALSPMPADTFVMLAEQAAGAGIAKVLVWRNMGDGTALGCSVPAGNGTSVLLFTGPDCTGATYGEASKVPVSGTACRFFDGVWKLVVAQGPVVTGLAFSSSRQEARACASGSVPSVPAVLWLDLGPDVPPPSPLRFVPP